MQSPVGRDSVSVTSPSFFPLSAEVTSRVLGGKGGGPGGRNDWLFLLPHLEVVRVLGLGELDAALLASLRRHAGQLALNPPQPRVFSFDLAVVCSRRRRLLEEAAQALRPGGVLYWELPPVWRCPWGRVPALTWSGTRRFLAGLGLRTLQGYWHRPQRLHCREILPLEGSPGASRLWIRSDGVWWRRLRPGALSYLLGGMTLSLILPCVSVVACKEGRGLS